MQEAIVREAHLAGLTAQAHCSSVEGLRCAIEAGCDLITHCNTTGPTPIPEDILELFLTRNVGAVVFPYTSRRLEWLFDQSRSNAQLAHTMYRAADINVRNLIDARARLMLATDGIVWPPEISSDPSMGEWVGTDVDNLSDLGEGHFHWLQAMEEKGCQPMEMLRAATTNVAIAYGRQRDLGSIEVGKLADLVILDKNPLTSTANYRSIHLIIKEGNVVDRDALPTRRILTRDLEPEEPEEIDYVPFMRQGRLPPCPMCFCGFGGH